MQQALQPAERPTFAIKNLSDVPAETLAGIRDSGGAKEVYVFVHPSYYIFFHDMEPISLEAGKNIVQTFIETEDNSSGAITMLLREYEKAEMQFLSTAKKENRTVVLITPGNYAQSSQYIYKNNPDAYTQYINELTQDAKNMFYLESRSANTGKLTSSDQAALINFLRQTGAEKVYVGGGYIGRCQKEVYNFLSEAWSKDNIAIVPELSAISPDDLSDTTAKMLLTANKSLNKTAINSFIINGGIKGLTSNRPNLKNISKKND